MCDIEWSGPAGDVKACGGDAMMRVSAFRDVNGFRPDLIAGEEPELCVRLRRRGWKIFRLDEAMTLHDAAMTSFRQWWRRSARAGHAFAEGAWLHGGAPERHGVRSLVRCLWWAAILPVVGLLSFVNGWLPGTTVLMLYPLQIARIAWLHGGGLRRGWLYAVLLMLGKFAELQGFAKFVFGRLSGRRARLMEYK
jgi:GT2 family glycosyltransferase